jgi:hypothetical protein
VKEIAAKVRQGVLLDTMITLLGGETRQLRFCLGRELAELGAVYGAIAANPRHVGIIFGAWNF